MRRPASLVLLLAAAFAAALAPRALAAQDGLDRACQAAGAGLGECLLAAASVRSIQPRIGTALWGGSPVPGTASTLGMRLGSFPRMSLSGRITVAPTRLPPLTDRTTDESRTAWITGFSGQATVALLTGFSPAPTVGGVLSLDAFARASYAPLPTDKGFDDGGVWGWLIGVRLGALRESFTLPGVSLSGSYGRSSEVAFGDPATGTTDGFFEGPISDLNATLALSKRVGPVGLTAGAAWDRYASDLQAGYSTSPGGSQLLLNTDAETSRWSGFLDVSWTYLIFHGTLEAGWQGSPEAEGVPAAVEADPIGWWGGFAFRVSI